MKYQKGGKRKRKVTHDYLNNKDVDSKRVVKTNRRGKTTVKERGDSLSDKEWLNPGQTRYKKIERKPYLYNEGENEKSLWSRKFKSKTNKEGDEIKRKERILFDEGKQMKKRKQRKVKFGRNKGKILSKTVSWKDGKRSVKKEYTDKINTDKLKKGGKKYQTGGVLSAHPQTVKEKKGQKYYDERNQRIRGKISGSIEKVGDGFLKAIETNMSRKGVGDEIIPTLMNFYGSIPGIAGLLATRGAQWVVDNIKPPTKDLNQKQTGGFLEPPITRLFED
tara:strand:+ start:182 stop:1012 length:831 start_codon:yes stop_codon:yes gene_type:complete